MALDEALLEKQVNDPLCLPIVRVYEWDRPAVSIGRLQPNEAVRRLYPGLPIVRRPTGGRAVVHGNDLTISVVMKLEWLTDETASSVLSSYRSILEGIVTALKMTGHQVGFGAQKLQSNRDKVDCFEVAAGCDLIDTASGQKIAGCAQRREGLAILQQMSIPFRFLRDKHDFLSLLPQGFESALSIREWQIIDTPGVVCYTVKEESEGSHPWPAKF